MHLAFLGINYWPDETGIAPFTTGRCEYLASRGHQVTVFTGFPYYPQWRVPQHYRGRLVSHERCNGVEILRSWLYVPSQVNARSRILHEASFVVSSMLRAFSHGIRSRPDLLIVTTPPLALSLSGIVLSRLWRIPFIQHVPDLQPDAALDLGMLGPGRLMNLLYGIELQGYRRASLVSTLTEAMRAKIIGKGVAPEKVVLFSDWARSELFEVPQTGGGMELRRSLGIGDELLVVHAGNMGIKQGLEVILGAAERSRDNRGIRYLLVGSGSVREQLEQRAKSAGLQNLTFVPLLPDHRFLELLAASDLSLVTQQKSVADIVFPSKVITLMSSARPIIASVSAGSEVARVLKEAHAGVIIKPEDPDALLGAIKSLRDDPERRTRLGANARTFAKRFWEKQGTLSTLESHLLRIAAADKSNARTEPAALSEQLTADSRRTGND